MFRILGNRESSGEFKTFGWLADVFPWYMTCMGNNSPDKVMTKVKVMLLLSYQSNL